MTKFLRKDATYPEANGGSLSIWDSGTTYNVGDIVVDREGIWRATDINLNVQPVSGDFWRLLAGNPWGQAHIDVGNIAAAPFYANPPAAPGVEILPTPEATLCLIPTNAYTLTTTGDPWFQEASPAQYWGNPQSGISLGFGSDLLQDQLQSDLSISQRFVWFPDILGIAENYGKPPDIIGQRVTIQTYTDASNGGGQIGTRAVTYRIYYNIIDSAIV